MLSFGGARTPPTRSVCDAGAQKTYTYVAFIVFAAKTQQTLRSRPLTRLDTRSLRPHLNPAVSPARWCRPRAPTVRSRIKCGCTRDIHRASRQNSRPTSVAALQTAPSAFPPKAGSAARCCQPRCSRYASGCCVAEPLTLIVLAAIAAGRRVIRTCKPPVTPTLFVPAENRVDPRRRVLLRIARF